MGLQYLISKFDLKHANFFRHVGASTINFIDIQGGNVTLKPGIVLNEIVWNEMILVFEIDEKPCQNTYSLSN